MLDRLEYRIICNYVLMMEINEPQRETLEGRGIWYALFSLLSGYGIDFRLVNKLNTVSGWCDG